MLGFFSKDKVSKLEEVLKKNAKSQILLKSELAAKISEIETFNDEERKRAVKCVHPYLLQLIDSELIHQQSIAKYLAICNDVDKSLIGPIIEHLERATKPKDKSNGYMMSAGMENRNFCVRMLREYPI